jgi:hypothetical protein
MTIDEAIKKIATEDEQFSQFTYIFDDWWDVDQAVSRAKLPAIAHILPIGGSMTMRNGRVYDRENVSVAFVDKVARDASGEDQRVVFERMKDAAKAFVRTANASGYFQSVIAWNYDVIYNQLASIVTGVMLTLEIEDNGSCLTTARS